ncbi:hypothetical protein NL518_28555, partial [Klebsiella pneumoniae]|nr:hypothetical protein [Klebsiella pneumoniae]
THNLCLIMIKFHEIGLSFQWRQKFFAELKIRVLLLAAFYQSVMETLIASKPRLHEPVMRIVGVVVF